MFKYFFLTQEIFLPEPTTTRYERQVRDEFFAGMRREFRTLDKNEDGRIARAELVSRLPDMQMRQAGGDQPQGRGPGGGGDRPPPRANG